MNPESPQRLPSAPEAVQKIFRERLQTILTSQLTVENIDSFADSAYDNLVIVTSDVVKQYVTQFPEESVQYSNPGKEMEDAAFKAFGLGEVGEMLDNIQAVKEKIDYLKSYISTSVLSTETVIVPPQEGVEVQLPEEGADGSIQEKKLIPRLLTLLYILKHDFDLTPEDLSVTKGSVRPEMWRKEPYYRVDVPSLERQVYICDEEGNASYIFDSSKLQELGTSIEELDASDKGEKNALIAQHLGIGVRIIQKSNWRQYVSEALTDIKAKENVQSRPVSEFTKRERRNFLPFNEFQTDVRALYPGKESEPSVSDWYLKEYKLHPNWNSAPDRYYKSKGWEGWPELVGVENVLKREFPAFDDFQAEVRAFYTGESSINKWYHEERKKHPKWHSAPDMYYKSTGWEGWSELVDKMFATFNTFQTEVQVLYPGKGNVQKWYKNERKERKEHSKWPSAPYDFYKSTGWEGWPELVGIENRLKKEFPTFDQFQAEVRAAYPGSGEIQKWYNKARMRGMNWPSNPQEHYASMGWRGFPELLGIENRLKKEFPTFDQFQAEVRALYSGKGNVQKWYKNERKVHPNWPSRPSEYYESKGWIGWRDLIKKKESSSQA